MRPTVGASATLEAVCYTSVTAVLLISSPVFSHHVTPPGHPERVERADVFDAIASRQLQNGGRVENARPATVDELLRIHDEPHLERIESTSGRAVMLDPDTFVSPQSATVARVAAGAAIQAAEHATQMGEPAFALVRPPGHHAERHRAMGFCLYNNAAIAAAAALARGVERVAIVDIDVHHGNGTQHAFYADARVLYVSTHQFPFYPGTGAVEDVGELDGAGFTLNVPLEAGANDADFLLVHEAVVLPVLDEFRPALTIVSAGYDAHTDDPLASMQMTARGYAVILKGLSEVARRHGALCAVTEGGYDLPALSTCLEASIRALDGNLIEPTDASPPTRRGERAVAAVRAAHTSFWRQL